MELCGSRDIIARVFKLKLDAMMTDLTKNNVLGRVLAGAKLPTSLSLLDYNFKSVFPYLIIGGNFFGKAWNINIHFSVPPAATWLLPIFHLGNYIFLGGCVE